MLFVSLSQHLGVAGPEPHALPNRNLRKRESVTTNEVDHYGREKSGITTSLRTVSLLLLPTVSRGKLWVI